MRGVSRPLAYSSPYIQPPRMGVSCLRFPLRGLWERLSGGFGVGAVTGTALIRPASAKAWDLRSAWATGRRVSVRTDIEGFERLEGIVSRVAPTSAFARIAGRVVPLDRVLSVHHPSRLGDSKAGKVWGGAGRLRTPQEERLFS